MGALWAERRPGEEVGEEEGIEKKGKRTEGEMYEWRRLKYSMVKSMNSEGQTVGLGLYP